MQRVPARQNGVTAEAERMPAPSPLLELSRRIRNEQGVSGLRDFLAAMAPFSAPNELRSVAEGFGMDYDAILDQRRSGREAAGRGGYTGNDARTEDFPGGRPPLGRMQDGFANAPQLMQLMSLMQGNRPQSRGPDPMQLMQLMQLIPLLQGMQKGGSPADMAQLMKMLGG